MATETVTTSDWSARPIFWDYDLTCDDGFGQNFYVKFFGGLYTNSMMLSQTAADVHALFEVGWGSSHYSMMIDDVIRGIMEKVMKRIMKRGNYHHVSILLDYLRRGLNSFDEDFILAIVLRGERAVERMYENETCDGALPSEYSQHAFTVAVAAVLHLLAFVFQYLIGYIDRGGTKTYSSGCFDFRASFVSVVLFHGAYVWIKFRQAARPPTGKRKARSTQLDHPGDDSYDLSRFCVRGEKFEARYTIPMDKRDTAHPVKQPRLTLGSHETREEAEFFSRVAQSYYDDQLGACCVKLGGYQFEFFVPPMSEQERCLVGEKKKKWVMKQVKDVGTKMYEAWAKQQIAVATGAGSSNPSSSLPFQPSLMRGQTADEPLHVLDRPSCPGLPCEETDREVLNRGSQRFQEQHQGPAAHEHSSEEFFPIDDGPRDLTDGDIEDMFGSIGPSDSEYAPIPGNDAFPYLGAGADAVEHGPDPLPQGIVGAGDAVLYSAGFGSTVIEPSEPLDLSQQYQQPQACGVQQLHQVPESQNPGVGLQQVHMPSQQNSGRLQEVEPSEQVSACEQCEPLREEVKRWREESKGWREESKGWREESKGLREEVKRLRIKNERFESMFQTVFDVSQAYYLDKLVV